MLSNRSFVFALSILMLLLIGVASAIFSYHKVEAMQLEAVCEEKGYVGETEKQAEVKQKLFDCLSKNKTQAISTPQLDKNEMNRIRMEFAAENPEIALSYSPENRVKPKQVDGREYVVGYKVYYLSEQGGHMRTEKLERVADRIVLEAEKRHTDSGKLLYVINWFAENCTYTDTPENMWNKNLYGCLVEKESTCMGFAEAFHLIMKRLDIPSSIVVDMYKKKHAWNTVLVDGKTLTVDLTELCKPQFYSYFVPCIDFSGFTM